MRIQLLLAVLVVLASCTKLEGTPEDAGSPGPEKLVLGKALEEPFHNFHSMFFLDATHGWVGGVDGAVWRLTPQGWKKATAIPSAGDITALFFLDAQTGFAATEAFGLVILKTADGGATWTRSLEEPSVSARINRLYFKDAQRGFAVAGPPNGQIYRTLNGGTTWDDVEGPDVGYRQLADITSSPDGKLWIAGSRSQGSDPLLLSSTDEGATWKAVTADGTLMLYDVDAPANGELWVTSSGSVSHSTDSGATWTRSSPLGSKISALAFADANRAIAVRGNAAMLAITQNGGTTWTEMNYVGGEMTQLFFSDVWVGANGAGFIVSGGDPDRRGTLFSFQLP
jgi:photosystem II stability/assembly factor-like uncharacterized protein